MKLVAALFHGHVLVIFIVHPHVPGNANLDCYTIDVGLKICSEVRVAKGHPAYVPPSLQCQLGGVSNKWCKKLSLTSHISTARSTRSPRPQWCGTWSGIRTMTSTASSA